MTKTLALLTALALLGLAPTVYAEAPSGPHVKAFEVSVGGATARGLLAIPHGDPTALVVVAHGYNASAETHRSHLRTLAEHGALAVAMDYRGASPGFPIRAGADDTLAATRILLDEYDVDRVVLVSIGMGAAVAGLVLAEQPRTFQHWLAAAPMSNLAETWAHYKAAGTGLRAAASAAREIEQETGGTPALRSAEYQKRTAVARVPDFQGLAGVIVVHAAYDGHVSYSQARELTGALRARDIPTDVYTILQGNPNQEGTTPTGQVGVPIPGLAGHGREGNDADTLTSASWSIAYHMLARADGFVPANREEVIDPAAELVLGHAEGLVRDAPRRIADATRVPDARREIVDPAVAYARDQANFVIGHVTTTVEGVRVPNVQRDIIEPTVAFVVGQVGALIAEVFRTVEGLT